MNNFKHLSLKKVGVDIIAAILLALWTYTAITKLQTRGGFARELHLNPLFKMVATPLSWAVPASEIVIVLLLFVEPTRHYGLKASSFLLTVFTLYLIYMLNLSVYHPCNCGGIISTLTWIQHLVLDLILLLLALIGIRLRTPP